ncbi:MAG: hypothetical protein DRP90_02405 [Planctomycetota bacterium]|nr:MAG: hypothetical protein DRP90_02405 [Planctomycetota bacterium]
MSERTEDRIKKMIVERLFLSVAPSEIEDDADLVELFGLDSIRLFEIAIGLESEFGVDLSAVEFDIENFSTVSKLAALVKKLQG